MRTSSTAVSSRSPRTRAEWESELPPLHACARGVGQIERVYHPDRLSYPLRRKGPRGSGAFERISWEEALDEVARQLLRVRAQYGNAAILDASRSGSLSVLHGRAAAQRFLYMFGGCTELWSNMSAEAEVFAVRMTYGAEAVYKSAGREPTDYVNSKLIVMWGWSPGDGTFGTGTYQYLKSAKKQGVRIVCVDPRRTRSSVVLADEHVFIQPSTDTAALIAMAYVIACEGLHDQAYCDRHVLGFDEAHMPPGAPAGSLLSLLSPRALGWHCQDARMGWRDHRHPRRHHSPARHRVRHHQARRPAMRLRTRSHGVRRAISSCRLRAVRHHWQCRHSRRQLGSKQWCHWAEPVSRTCRPAPTR